MERPTTVLESAASVPIATRAISILRTAILNGTLKPGQQLIETDLAEQMHISRAPLREALWRLEEVGLVERVPYRGTYVTGFTEQAIRELYGIRGVLEAYALRLLPREKRAEQVQQLEVALDAMRAAAAIEDVSAMNAADVTFHRQLIQLADHHLLEQIWNSQESNIWRTLALCNRLRSDTTRILDDYKLLLAALANDDLAGAEEAIRVYLEVSCEMIVRNWRTIMGDSDSPPA
jgi:DNA-binding GntR family transcriptional regulator